MATTISIEDLGNGNYRITDSDQQTRVVGAPIATQEAGKSGVQIKKTGNTSGLPGASSTKDSTGYTNNAAGQNYPDGTPTVIVNGKTISVTDAINQARSAKNLGLIRKNLLASKQLTKAEAKDPNNLLDKWSQIVYGASQDSDQANRDPFVYAKSLQRQGFESTAGVQTYEPFGQQTIWTPDKAQAFVKDVYKSQLHRLPTDAELAKETNSLIKQQQKASSSSKTTYKIINGVRTQVTTNGFDEQDWLNKRIQKTPEYVQSQKDLNTAAMQEINAVAKANNVPLTPSVTQLYATRLANGEDINIIKATIRDLAKLGQPTDVVKLLDQGVDLKDIYSPYTRLMADTLELDPNSINLTDPALTSAFSSSGSMPLYDFQRALRQDSRWQYTNNARDEVSQSVMGVLKDFGFKG